MLDSKQRLKAYRGTSKTCPNIVESILARTHRFQSIVGWESQTNHGSKCWREVSASELPEFDATQREMFKEQVEVLYGRSHERSYNNQNSFSLHFTKTNHYIICCSRLLELVVWQIIIIFI